MVNQNIMMHTNGKYLFCLFINNKIFCKNTQACGRMSLFLLKDVLHILKRIANLLKHL